MDPYTINVAIKFSCIVRPDFIIFATISLRDEFQEDTLWGTRRDCETINDAKCVQRRRQARTHLNHTEVLKCQVAYLPTRAESVQRLLECRRSDRCSPFGTSILGRETMTIHILSTILTVLCEGDDFQDLAIAREDL